MTKEVDEFCAWARPCNGTYLNPSAFNAQEVWRAAQEAVATCAPVNFDALDASRYRKLRAASIEGQNFSVLYSEKPQNCVEAMDHINGENLDAILDEISGPEVSPKTGYFALHEFATKKNLDYNELCRVVRECGIGDAK